MRMTAIGLLTALLLSPTAVRAEPATYEIDSVHSHVGFGIRHFLTTVNGRFTEVSGTIVYDAEDISSSSVTAVISAASINTDNTRRDDHLRSADFFEVEKYPEVTFTSTKVAKEGDQIMVTGVFEMHGVKKTITLPVTFLGVMGPKAGFSTRITLDRTEFGVTYNRALEGGGTVLGDEVEVRIDIEANLKEEEKE